MDGWKVESVSRLENGETGKVKRVGEERKGSRGKRKPGNIPVVFQPSVGSPGTAIEFTLALKSVAL